MRAWIGSDGGGLCKLRPPLRRGKLSELGSRAGNCGGTVCARGGDLATEGRLRISDTGNVILVCAERGRRLGSGVDRADPKPDGIEDSV